MKNYNKILEAVNRGLKLALDDFDDELVGQQTSSIKNQNITKDYIALQEMVVDLGLPSGTLWCKYNLGCDYKILNTHPEYTNFKAWFGDYYAWGELEDKSKHGKDYNWRTYKFGKRSDELTKYITDEQYASYFDDESEILVNIDNLTLLQPEDDVAYLNLHCGQYKFNIPTTKLFEELKKYTTKEWIEDIEYNGKFIKGLYGMIFKSKINGNKIFFPAAGDACSPGYYDFGEYWSSNVYNTEPDKAWSLHISSDCELGKLCYIHASKRYEGYSIRPVVNI